MRRRWPLGIAVLLGLMAGVLVYGSIRVAPAVVAARDLTAGERLTAQALMIRDANPNSLPPGAFQRIDDAVGAYVNGPIPAGQFIVAGQLAQSRQAALLAHAGPLPPDHALIAIPIDATRAVGGVVRPAQRVDVLVVGSTNESSVSSMSGVEVLGRGVLLIELRTDRGEALIDPAGPGGLEGGAAGRVGSAVLVVPAADVPRYVERIPTGMFVLSQRVDDPLAPGLATAPQAAGRSP